MAGHDVWHTPPDLFRVLDAEFTFEVDAAATKANALCESYITPEMDALTAPWGGRCVVWCNPPYSQIGAFVYRAWEQCQAGKNTVVLLIPAYTDPAYWWDCIVPFADEIRFLRGRVSFLEHGRKKESARFPSVVVVFRWRAGIQKGAPRVFWWDWKAAAEPTTTYTMPPSDRAPLFAVNE